MNQAAAEQDLAEEKPSDKPARSETKLTVTETYNIENSPWNNVETQGVNFEDYKARIKAQLEQENFKQNLEQNRLGDLTKDDTEVTKFDKQTEEERDRKMFDDYLKKGLVNIKNLVLKNPVNRTDKENEFLILYLKH